MSGPRLDLYTEVHKGLRAALFEVSRLTGRVDWGDADRVEDLRQTWTGLLELLRAHVAHERDIVHPLLDLRLPGVAHALDADHELQEALLDDLELYLEHLLDVQNQVLRQAMGLEFYRVISRFIGLYLPHLDGEETQIMPSLWEVAQPGELAQVLSMTIGSMSLELLLAYVDEMLPAMNHHERHAFLTELRHAAPLEVFEAVLDRAEEILPKPAWSRLAKAMLTPTATELVEL